MIKLYKCGKRRRANARSTAITGTLQVPGTSALLKYDVTFDKGLLKPVSYSGVVPGSEEFYGSARLSAFGRVVEKFREESLQHRFLLRKAEALAPKLGIPN